MKKKSTQKLSKKDPIAPTKKDSLVQEFVPSVDQDQLYKDIASPITDCIGTRGVWESKKDMYYRMRMRIRKDKSFPFHGCSNLRMPTIEKYIRKTKAYLYNLIFGLRPKAMVVAMPSGNQDAAFKLEYYLDWLIEVKLNLAKKLNVLIDKMLEKGFAFTETIWKIEDEPRTFEVDLADMPQDLVKAIMTQAPVEEMTDAIINLFEIDKSDTVLLDNKNAIANMIMQFRNGKTKVKVTVKDETYNNVVINIHDPSNVYAPVDSGIDIQDCRWIAVETYEPWETVKLKGRDGVYNAETIEYMKAFSSTGKPPSPSEGKNSMDTYRRTPEEQDMKEGIDRINNASGNVKIWRCYAWYDLDGDGVEERNVFILAPEWKKVLAAFPYTYAHRKWPIQRFDNEVIDDRWYSTRGIPEIIEDIVKEIDTQHNQKVDQQTIRNTPMFAFRPGVTNPRLIKFIPGQAIPVQGTMPLSDALQILSSPNLNVEYSYKDEEMQLKGECQELLGQVDYTMQSQINKREPRTASEAMSQAQQANLLSSLQANLFSDSFSEVLNQAIQLTQQFLPNEVYFNIIGEQQKLRLTREEIQGQYLVRIRGNDTNYNPIKRVEMAQARMQTLINPMFFQSGIITPVQIYALLKEFLQESGDFNWQNKIAEPQPPPPPLPPPAFGIVKPKYENLTPGEQMQVLVSGGIKPDVVGHALQKEQELNESRESEESAGAGSVA